MLLTIPNAALLNFIILERKVSVEKMPVMDLHPLGQPSGQRTSWHAIARGLHRLRGTQQKARGLLARALWEEAASYAPLSPMASTGQPSLASLQRASSSGDAGCLKTYE